MRPSKHPREKFLLLLLHPTKEGGGGELRKAHFDHGTSAAVLRFDGLFINDKGFGYFIGWRLRPLRPFSLGEIFTAYWRDGRGVHIEDAHDIALRYALARADVQIDHKASPFEWYYSIFWRAITDRNVSVSFL